MNSASLRMLDAMGLTVWQPRLTAGDATPDRVIPDRPAGEPPGTEVYPGRDPVSLVLVVTPADFRVSMQTRDGAMMARILEAMRAPKGAFAVRHVRATALTDAYPLAGYAPVLVFGAVHGEAPSDWVVMPSLETMLENPERKRDAWEQLKPLVGTIGVTRR